MACRDWGLGDAGRGGGGSVSDSWASKAFLRRRCTGIQAPGDRGGRGGLPGGRGCPHGPHAAAGRRVRAGAAAATGGAARRRRRRLGARRREAGPGRPPCPPGPAAPAVRPWRAGKRCRGRSRPEGERAPVGGARRSPSPELRGRGRSRKFPTPPGPAHLPRPFGTARGVGGAGAARSLQAPPRPPLVRSSSLPQNGRSRTPIAPRSSRGWRFCAFFLSLEFRRCQFCCILSEGSPDSRVRG